MPDDHDRRNRAKKKLIDSDSSVKIAFDVISYVSTFH